MIRVAATILLAFLAFAGEAAAATVSVTGATLQVTAAPGEANVLAIASADGVLSVTDAGAPVTAGSGCVVAGAAVECTGLPLLDERKYRVHISDGYARTGHAKHGEHPIGLAVDIVPGPGGSWSDVDRLARWAEPRQNRPRSPFRWVGYNGDRNHGRGNHLHLSWRHTPTKRGRPARTVWTLSIAR